jgi:biotin synthase-like enzyme
VQLNALSEASSLGLSTELGAILGVPESIISDAAANLGFGRMTHYP